MEYALAAMLALIAFAAGYFLGKKRSSAAAPFADEEVAEEMSERAVAAVHERTEKRKDRIMALAFERGSIQNDDVEDLFCISDSTARRYLRELAETGALIREGDGRGTTYTPAENR